MIENPYRFIRRRLKLSRGALGFATSTLSRIENGQYETLSDEMVARLLAEAERLGADLEVLAGELEERFGTPYLGEAYLRWRKMRRKVSGDLVKWPKLGGIRRGVLVGQSPVEALAKQTAVTVDRFCTLFCLQEPTMRRYMRGSSGRKQLVYAEPAAAVREALEDAGYPDLEELVEMQRRWLDGER